MRTVLVLVVNEAEALPTSPVSSASCVRGIAYARRCQHATTAAMLRLRGGKEQNAKGSPDLAFGSKVASGDGVVSDGRRDAKAPKIDSSDAKEMLYQLTTQLFNPNKSNKMDFYEVLGVSRTASHKVRPFDSRTPCLLCGKGSGG